MRRAKRIHGKVWQPEEEPVKPMIDCVYMWDDLSFELGSSYICLKANDKMKIQIAIQQSL